MIYQFLRQIIKVCLFFFFKKIVVSGNENIQDVGPLILVANHPNTFMDPLIISVITKQRIGFIANASIFSNKILSTIFSYFHVIPIFRKKDIKPGENPDNKATFRKCHEYLSQAKTLLIFPEGTSYYELKLREIKTGTARIALSFEELNNFEGNLKIIPIALDYSDAIQFRSMVSVTICPSISVNDYKHQYQQNEVDGVLTLTDDIRKELAKNIPQTSGKEQEGFLVKAHKFYATFYDPSADLEENPKHSLELRNQVSKAINYLHEHSFKLYVETQTKVLHFFNILDEEKLTPDLISTGFLKKSKPLFFVSNFLQFLFLLPIYIFGLIVNYLPYILPVKIFNFLKMDIEYKAPIQMIAGLIIFPLFYSLDILIFRTYVSRAFWYSLLFALILPVSGYIAMYYYAEMKSFAKVLHYSFFMKKSKKILLNELRDEILKIMDEVRKKLGLIGA